MGSGQTVELVPVEDITFAWETEPVSGPQTSGVELKNFLEGELLDGTATSWLANETPQDYATDPQGRGSLLSTIGMPRWSHEQVLFALKITEEQSEFRGDDAEVLVGRRAGVRDESGVSDRDRDRGAERR